MCDISSVLKKIPTVDSCWLLGLRTGALAIGVMEIIYCCTQLIILSSSPLAFLVQFRPWVTVSIVVLFLLAHIGFVFGIYQKKRVYMLPALILPTLQLLFLILLVCALPIIGTIGFISDANKDGLQFAGLAFFACIALAKETAMEVFLWVVKCSLYKSMKDDEVKSSTAMHSIFL